MGALQFVWIAGHRRHMASHDDYFAELVEHLTAVTPDIDCRVARLFRRYRRHADEPTPTATPAPDSGSRP